MASEIHLEDRRRARWPYTATTCCDHGGPFRGVLAQAAFQLLIRQQLRPGGRTGVAERSRFRRPRRSADRRRIRQTWAADHPGGRPRGTAGLGAPLAVFVLAPARNLLEREKVADGKVLTDQTSYLGRRRVFVAPLAIDDDAEAEPALARSSASVVWTVLREAWLISGPGARIVVVAHSVPVLGPGARGQGQQRHQLSRTVPHGSRQDFRTGYPVPRARSAAPARRSSAVPSCAPAPPATSGAGPVAPRAAGEGRTQPRNSRHRPRPRPPNGAPISATPRPSARASTTALEPSLPCHSRFRLPR